MFNILIVQVFIAGLHSYAGLHWLRSGVSVGLPAADGAAPAPAPTRTLG